MTAPTCSHARARRCCGGRLRASRIGARRKRRVSASLSALPGPRTSCLALRLDLHGAAAAVAELEAAVVTRAAPRAPLGAADRGAARFGSHQGCARSPRSRPTRRSRAELGARPGPVLQTLEDELFVSAASPIDDPALRLERHREAADAALADGDVRRAAKELAAAADIARVTERPATAQADLQIALGRLQLQAGEPAAARDAFTEAATLGTARRRHRPTGGGGARRVGRRVADHAWTRPRSRSRSSKSHWTGFRPHRHRYAPGCSPATPSLPATCARTAS